MQPVVAVALHVAKILAEGTAALAGLVGLIVVLFGLRLAAAPMELDFLTPAFNSLLSRLTAPYITTAGATRVSWHGFQSSLDLSGVNLTVTGPDGKEVAVIPSVDMSFDLRRLVLGEIAATTIAASGLQLRLIATPGGSIDLSGQSETIPTEPFLQTLRSAATNRDRDDALGRLRHVRLDHADIRYDDPQRRATLRVTDVSAHLDRGPSGVDGAVSGGILLGETRSPLSATVHVDADARILNGKFQFDPLDPAALAPFAPADLPLGQVHVPVAGHGELSVDLGALRPGRGSLALHFGDGNLETMHVAAGRLHISGGELAANYDPAAAKLTVAKLLLEFGGPSITASAVATSVSPAAFSGTAPPAPIPVSGKVEVLDMPLARLAEFWPLGVAEGGREWVAENLSAGSIDSFDGTASLKYYPNKASATTLESFDGKMTIHNATIDYLHGLPKAEGVSTTASLTPDRLTFAIDEGRVAALAVTGGTVVLDQFDAPEERATIDLDMEGAAADVLAVIDVPRLRYASAMGLTPSRVGGAVNGSLHFQMPLKRDLPIDEVMYGAKAQLSDLAVPSVALGRDLTDGSLSLLLDHDHVTLDGTARLDQVPATLTWTQRISGNSEPHSRVHVKAKLDDHARERFRFDVLPDNVHGPVGAEAVYEELGSHDARASVGLDLVDADLMLPLAGWEKPPGRPGKASFKLTMQNDEIKRVSDVKVDTLDFSVAGNLDLDAGSIRRGEIDHITVGKTNASGTVDHPAGQPWQIALRGKSVDAEPVLKDAQADGPVPPTEPAPSIALDVATDHMFFGPHRDLGHASFRGLVANRTLQWATLTGSPADQKTLSVRLDPVTSGGRISGATDDFGSALGLAGVTEDVMGGSVAIEGTSALEGDARRFRARVQGSNYSVINMPFLTRLLSLASFQSIANLVTGGGIPFSTLRADLTLKTGRLDVAGGHALGNALGVNADGWIDLKAGTLALDGRLVPAYLLNSLLGDIPLIGPALVGGEGEGLFDVNFKVGGAVAEPSVTVNPLSPFAPGFLRDLFVFAAPTPAAAKP